MNGPPSSTPRVPWRVQTTGTPRSRAAPVSDFTGSITRCMCAMSIPDAAYQPSACRKSFWRSMWTRAVWPGTRSQCASSYGSRKSDIRVPIAAPPGLSRQEAHVTRVVERLFDDDGRPRPAQDVDRELRRGHGVLDRQVRERDALLNDVAVAAGGDIADRGALAAHRLVAVRVGVVGLDRETGEHS